MASIKRIAGRLGYYGILVLVALLSLGPTLWVVLSSFKTTNQIFSATGFLPKPVTLQGYSDVFTEVHLDRYLLNTAIYSIGGTLGALTVGLLAAYPLARFAFRGRNALVAVFSLALAIPVVGLATPEFFVMLKLGLLDSTLGLVIFYAALEFPLAFVILRAFLISLPRDVEEAAIMDGAGYFTMMRRVVLPLSRPALATVAVVSFVQIWNEFFFANLLLTSEQHQNVQLALASFRTAFTFNAGGAMAGATLVMLVPILAFLVLQRQVIAGLTAGATR
jgi:ABC-type glycerol-3-phosphate transport system permease component